MTEKVAAGLFEIQHKEVAALMEKLDKLFDSNDIDRDNPKDFTFDMAIITIVLVKQLVVTGGNPLLALVNVASLASRSVDMMQAAGSVDYAKKLTEEVNKKVNNTDKSKN